MPKPLKLTAAALAKKVVEDPEDIILFEEKSSIKTFHLARVKNITDVSRVGRTIYKMPPDTVSILHTNSRNRKGEAETDVLKIRLDSPKAVVVPMAPKMVHLLEQMERKSGYPLKVVFAKREKGNLFLCHKEMLELPLPAKIKAFGQLLAFSNREDRLRILQKVPQDLGVLQTHAFGKIPKTMTVITGTPAYPGVLVVSPDARFARETTSPADVAEMKGAKVIITGGGTLSHAALLASSEGIPCIVGVSAEDILKINTSPNPISVDAYAGKMYMGELPIVEVGQELVKQMTEILDYARELTDMEVYANADSAFAIAAALERGAQGIGLYRTEHMFQDHTLILSKYIECALKNDMAGRREVLAKLLAISRERFKAAFEALADTYIAIRLLDAPLNEFSPSIKEANPMMGLRGCRFGILFSDFYVMQVQAIAEAYAAAKGQGIVGIMVPLISEVGEVVVLRDLVQRVWRACGREAEALSFGAMIETPRACMISGEIAAYCKFLSYGSNDLTQFTYAFSRDDAKYLPNYVQLGVLETNPFQTLDPRGVGRLLYLSAKTAKSVNPEIKLGLCGNHAGDPASVQMVRSLGFDYVSCTQANIQTAVLAMVQSPCRKR